MKITLMMVMTADGKIARNDNHFPDWSSKEDKRLFAEITKKAGVIIMGDKTYFTMPGPLPGRLNVVFTQEENPPATKGVRWVSGEIEPVLKELETMGFSEAILGGGAFLNSQFLEKKLIDEIILTIESKLFGQGLSIFSQEFDLNLELIDTKKLNQNSIMLKYKVIY